MDDGSPHWFKSSYSSFADNCVEVAASSGPGWFKSSHSSFKDGGCVEVAFGGTVAVLVRDTQNRGAAVVGVGAGEWSCLVSLVADRRG